MTALRLAIIGGGHLGRIHARLASADGPYQVVGVVDPTEAARELVTEQLGLPTCADYRELIGKIDAAIVAAPTAN
ncbi:MAG TPA: gfo/Idh/MocA family oxidoreductase, partial [Planctomycetaceae bacterium]|nr:gfo/Idh/MocA family oxidoreductase [Planctomycetaceae bacterium]